ncbi:MAG TPA: hypothetical protein VGQ69_13560 [Gemmatimonadales bacterium]|nr:hypothetical protein [Gemmatimonadales bacterium]
MKGTRLLVALASVGLAPSAWALGTSTWNPVCSHAGVGIAAFSTCASSQLFLAADGGIALRSWNLSGLPASNADPNASFTAIGLENLGVTATHSGQVQFSFQVGATFVSENLDPATRLGFHGQGVAEGSSGYSCAVSNNPHCGLLETTHAPEPMTMTLLASGLVGLGCVGLIRRRRETQSVTRT